MKKMEYLFKAINVLMAGSVILLSSCNQPTYNAEEFSMKTFNISEDSLTNKEVTEIKSENNILQFDDTATFLKMLNTSNESNSKVSNLSNFEIDKKFTSMLDVEPKAGDFKSEEEFYEYLSKYPKILYSYDYTSSEGKNVKVFDLPVTKQLATLINPEGLISVGGKTYDVLDNTQLEDLLNNCKTVSENKEVYTIPEVTFFIPLRRNITTDARYQVTDRIIDINGRGVVVQMWKGFCIAIGGVGGVGAEIGLYNTLVNGSDIWFPDFCHCVNMSYILNYTGSIGTHFSYLTAVDYTWWLNAWRINEIPPTQLGTEYTLEYNINGTLGSWK